MEPFGGTVTAGYVFGESLTAQRNFGGRSIEREFPLLVPHLAAGMRVVDCGCGPGSITLGLARLVNPGEVIGFDCSEQSLQQGRAAAAAAGVANVRFQAGDILETGLAAEIFDVAVVSNVLAHVPQAGRGAQEVLRLLKPGGLFAIREMNKSGDWMGGAYAGAVLEANGIVSADIRRGGGDPDLGRSLVSFLTESGFEVIEAAPSYSVAMSSPTRTGPMYLDRLADAGFAARAAAAGTSGARLIQLREEIGLWMKDPSALLALAECVALARKPIQ